MIAKWALSGGVPPPKPSGYFRSYSLRLPLGWFLSLAGVSLCPERGRRGGRVLKRKRLKRSFKIRYVFIILKKSAKIRRSLSPIVSGSDPKLPLQGGSPPGNEWGGALGLVFDIILETGKQSLREERD